MAYNMVAPGSRARLFQIGRASPRPSLARLARPIRVQAAPSDPSRAISGALDQLAAQGGDMAAAAKDAVNGAAAAAKDATAEAGDTAKAAVAGATGAAKAAATDAAAAAKAAAADAAAAATAALDSFASELDASAIRLKEAAADSTDAAVSAFDAFSQTAAVRMSKLAGALVPGDAEARAKLEEIAGSFSAPADKLRMDVASGKTSGAAAIDELSRLVASKAAQMRSVAAGAAAGVAARVGGGGSGGGAAAGPGQGGALGVVGEYLQLWGTLGSLYYLDVFIKQGLLSAGIKFPSALAGMFGVVAVLCVVGDQNAGRLLSLYGPALNWIARWLPLFYVPALVTLPLALNGIPGGDLVRIVGILSVGMVATLLFTAQVTVLIREAVKTPVVPVAKGKPSAPFEASHFWAWGAVAAASLAATAFGPPDLAARMALPFGLAATVGGYLIGSKVPANLQGVLHPVVVTAVLANAGAALWGSMQGLSYAAAQKVYLAKGAGPLGAGDLLMSLLGVVIISFGFRVYTQRGTMQRHFPEIVGATVLSSVFSLFSTALAAKAVGLGSELARALIPRSVTVALALPIAQGLEAPLAITAAAVLLQGILGANFGPGLMTAVGIKDTIARGLAAAGTAGGLGTASLTSKEPEALPFCALSYALVGIFSTVIMSVPAVQGLAISIVG